MPSERRGTVTEDIAAYIRRLKGTSEWKGDKSGTIRAPVAKVRLYSIAKPQLLLNARHSCTILLKMSSEIYVIF